MTDRIRIGDQWYVAATSARSEESPQTLKHDESFALFDRFGDIPEFGSGEHGLYHEDTRHVSIWELRLDGVRPLYLGSTVQEDNSLLAIDLMNPDMPSVPQGTLHLFRAKLVWEGRCHEHLRVVNHGLETIQAKVSIVFDADFADLFEVRGMTRERRGVLHAPEVQGSQVVLAYDGRDKVRRRTRITFEPRPVQLDARQALFPLSLAPGADAHVYCTVSCESDVAAPVGKATDYQTALASIARSRQAAREGGCRLHASNPLVNLWLDRSTADLAMLTTALPEGAYPYAGVPWYSTTFGRDGIITAREMLWIDPSIARGVLSFLARTQAVEADADQDAEPGKILHEARRSEMARTREIPFGRYYGTVDATPLFVALVGAYHRRTGDLEFVRQLWPHVLAALRWIDEYGDLDGDGFVEYNRRSRDGLTQQGWKDSQDSVFHADGCMAEPPIALCEVQAYVYEAKAMAAELAAALGDDALAGRLRLQAHELQRHFDDAFWSESIGSYVIALDGRKRRCEVRTSNPGHALWSGIATAERAERIVEELLSERFYNGWGIRTVAEGEPRYNPMSYHNGSIWPHDNALIAAGMGRYGYTARAAHIATGLFDASRHFDHHRLPELFCGFPRRRFEGPVLYPVACAPQAWAAAAVFQLLQACLGLDIDAPARRVSLRAPTLPAFIDKLRIQNLAVGSDRLDLLLLRHAHNTSVEVLGKDGGVEVALFA